MRKLKLQVQVSLDGYIGGPNGEMDWMSMPWTDDINQYVSAISSNMDTIVLGRKLAQGFIPYWAGVAADKDNPEQESGKQFTSVPKLVFSETLDPDSDEVRSWPNAKIAEKPLLESITALKEQPGKDIFAYGGADFVSSLIQNDLIDEYFLFINPTALGQGLPIFQRKTLIPVETKHFDCGITLLKMVRS